MNNENLKNEIIQNLKKIYKIAMQTENFNLALQTQKTLMSLIAKTPNQKTNASIHSFSNEQIEQWIKELEQENSEPATTITKSANGQIHLKNTKYHLIKKFLTQLKNNKLNNNPNTSNTSLNIFTNQDSPNH